MKQSIVIGVLLSVGGIACSGSNPASTGAQVSDLQLDCSPRVTEVAHFDGTCQYVGADVPLMTCPQSASKSGSLTMTVLRPQDVTAGQRIAVGGTNPIVKVDAAATASDLLVESTTVGGVGFVVFDHFEPGRIMSGAFVDTSVEMQPDPPFPCRLSSGHFDASSGPGVTAP
jgi:hypothetical protein